VCPGTVRRLVDRAGALATRLSLALACVALLVAVVCGLYQVFTRFVLDLPSVWSEVVVRTAIVWMVYLGLAASFQRGALVCLDFLRSRAPRCLRPALLAFVTLSNFAVVAAMLVSGIRIVERVSAQTLVGLEISIAWAYAALPVGSGFAVVALCGNLARHGLELPSDVKDPEGRTA
jgi:TRAP-type C4-dicarboxylate transport system permease small subunit